jgi:anti-sigma regulatory factor (Ser/Thr protein kinase)
VYRILQESITNIIRHVGPTRVTVAIDHDTEIVEVRVTDDGPRITPEAATPSTAPQTADGSASNGTPAPERAGRGILGMPSDASSSVGNSTVTRSRATASRSPHDCPQLR